MVNCKVVVRTWCKSRVCLSVDYPSKEQQTCLTVCLHLRGLCYISTVPTHFCALICPFILPFSRYLSYLKYTYPISKPVLLQTNHIFIQNGSSSYATSPRPFSRWWHYAPFPRIWKQLPPWPKQARWKCCKGQRQGSGIQRG